MAFSDDQMWADICVRTHARVRPFLIWSASMGTRSAFKKFKLHSLKSSNSFSGNNLCVLALRLISGWFLFSILVRILSFNSAFYDFLSSLEFFFRRIFRKFSNSLVLLIVVVRIATREGVVCLYTKIKLQNTEKLAPIQSKNDVTWLDPIKLIGWLTIFDDLRST